MDFNVFRTMAADELGLEVAALTEEASLLTDLGVDSLTLANFIIRLELRYGIKVPVTNVWDVRTVRDAYAIFDNALRAKEQTVKGGFGG